ncbi:glucose-1-phosphate cytidylyltransferase [Roseomonas sp. GC11]|uniref:glucose-1-phosphate cytidylyltransferase n=1 Tax=Roseomonas sp. GC11 TaxID=2950546 RepID=UPI00210C2DCC|nr:glucose-1-phosphate cytidylyltransferase [Roseomonas sp. GC11]MCQ4159628.1 glucose-1-phosphate cytidylyltransferase [Roseomonas sp. GC11]
MSEQKRTKAVILAGGRGSRLAEETSTRPKPMVEVGGHPILWHIMKTYSHYGVNDFVICVGYLGYVIKEYFYHYYLHHSDVTIDVRRGQMTVHDTMSDDWRVTLVETGLDTQTGGRLRRVRPYLQDCDHFCMTYGDGVGSVDIGAAIDFHRGHGKLATVTAVQPMARFGALVMEGDRVDRFEEKPPGDGNHINGGFFVLSPKVIDLIADDTTIWEREPMETLARTGELMAYRHSGYWQPMDTLRDRQTLNDLWNSGRAPWKVW